MTSGSEEKTLKTVAIVQARMASTRLPGKVLMDLGGQTVLARVIRRLSRATLINQVAIATTTANADSAIVAEATRLGTDCFRGSEQDVLGRYLAASEAFSADVVVRVTSDCPVIDPVMADDVVQDFFNERADFAFNDVPDRLPRGLDVEVFSLQALRRAGQMTCGKYQREHVTPVFYDSPGIFKVVKLRAEQDFSQYRWTLDTPEDLQLIRAIYGHFSNRDDFGWLEVAEWMERAPELSRINSHVIQKSTYEVAPKSS